MVKYINKKTGIAAAAIILTVIAALVIAPNFSQALSLDEAKNIAKGYVPSTASFVKSEEEDNKFEVMFHDDKAKAGYEVEVHKDTKKVKKVEFQLDNDRGSKTVKLKKAGIKKVVKKNFPGIESVSVMLSKDNGRYKYEADFKGSDFYGDAELHPVTGKVLESTVKYGTAIVIPKDNASSNKSKYITQKKAEKAALNVVGGGFVKDVDFEKENGKYVYEIEVIKNNKEYDCTVDAKTGKATIEKEHKSYFKYTDKEKKSNTDKAKKTTVKKSNKASSNNLISASKAKQIVSAKLPGATIKKLKLEKDDGRYVYEGEAVLGDYEYDFEINAATGVILDWEKDRIDDDDDDDDDDDYDDD